MGILGNDLKIQRENKYLESRRPIFRTDSVALRRGGVGGRVGNHRPVVLLE